jgi:hypothetical protein
MNGIVITLEAAAGTALYFSKHNGWSAFGENHGTRVIVVDGERAHWAYNGETGKYGKKDTASTFYRSRTMLGYLVREVRENGEEGREFIARAAHLRGAWTACQSIVQTNQAAQDKLRQQREETREHAEAIRAAIIAEFGLKLHLTSGSLATEVTVSGTALLAMLRQLRDAA